MLIEAYCHQGNLAGATNLIEHIKALNLPIWENVYANLVTAHARSGDITGAEGILDVMKENGHLPGMNSYTALFCAFAEKGDLAGIERVSILLRNTCFNLYFKIHGFMTRVRKIKACMFTHALLGMVIFFLIVVIIISHLTLVISWVYDV